MKLSEAIREGCRLIPRQAHGEFIVDDCGQRSACALGAAAVGIDPEIATLPPMAAEAQAAVAFQEECLEEILDESRVHPVSGDVEFVSDIVISLNDGDMWSRERIADWLEAEGL